MGRLLPGFVVEVVRPGGASGKTFLGRRFSLSEWRVIDGKTCWRAPESWSRYLSARTGTPFDLYIQEDRLAYVHSGNIKVSWVECAWHPHWEVFRDPRDATGETLINVWEPVDGSREDRE